MGNIDMLLAEKFNCIKILVRTGWGESSLNEYRNSWENVEPDYTADNILDASKWIVRNFENSSNIK